MVFKDVEQLKKYLKEDRDRADLNPIRFINVDSLQMWVEVKKYDIHQRIEGPAGSQERIP